jgi:hypothetical protein
MLLARAGGVGLLLGKLFSDTISLPPKPFVFQNGNAFECLESLAFCMFLYIGAFEHAYTLVLPRVGGVSQPDATSPARVYWSKEQKEYVYGMLFATAPGVEYEKGTAPPDEDLRTILPFCIKSNNGPFPDSFKLSQLRSIARTYRP